MRETKARLKKDLERIKAPLISELTSQDFSHRTYEFRMGFESVSKGPDTTNCNFKIFSRPELTKEWELGAQAARAIIEMNTNKEIKIEI